ncbi:MAG TPA: hypothetical protein VIP75_07185 [Acidothermales bacterium]
MAIELRFSPDAAATLRELEAGSRRNPVRLRKVRKALGRLELDPRHPALHSHQYEQFPGLEKAKVWDSYVDHRTSDAWRIYWMYGPDEERDGRRVPVITVLVISPHP